MNKLKEIEKHIDRWQVAEEKALNSSNSVYARYCIECNKPENEQD